jgi:Zn-dependent peptidase ImmA (M78 family)
LITIEENSEKILQQDYKKLTTGKYNQLLNYICYSISKGSIIYPYKLKSSKLHIIQKEFINYCPYIREILKSQIINGNKNAEYGLRILHKEVGSFWICGKLNDVSEFYVCYEDSVPQNIIELMFRMNLDLF